MEGAVDAKAANLVLVGHNHEVLFFAVDREATGHGVHAFEVGAEFQAGVVARASESSGEPFVELGDAFVGQPEQGKDLTGDRDHGDAGPDPTGLGRFDQFLAAAIKGDVGAHFANVVDGEGLTLGAGAELAHAGGGPDGGLGKITLGVAQVEAVFLDTTIAGVDDPELTAAVLGGVGGGIERPVIGGGGAVSPEVEDAVLVEFVELVVAGDDVDVLAFVVLPNADGGNHRRGFQLERGATGQFDRGASTAPL